jgi:hypothetical protein
MGRDHVTKSRRAFGAKAAVGRCFAPITTTIDHVSDYGADGSLGTLW